MTCTLAKFEGAMSKGLGGDAFTGRVKVTENVIQYPLHYVTYAPVKFEVNTSNDKEDMHLQEKTLFDL